MNKRIINHTLQVPTTDHGDVVDVTTSVPPSPPSLNNNASCWSVFGNNSVFYACDSTTPSLPADYYTIKPSERGPYLERMNICVDSLIRFPDSATDNVIKQLRHFWNSEHLFRELGFLWKRGIMMYGPPGSGKSATVEQICKEIINLNGIAIFVDSPKIAAHGLHNLRTVEPTRPIVVILEDIDSIISQYSESDLLSLLDGELQVDNIVFIATTNYPERLPKRIINRPSRFDSVIFVDTPSDSARKLYLEIKHPTVGNNEVVCKKWVDATRGFSIAHLKELIVAVHCLGQDFDHSVDRLNKMIKAEYDSTKFENVKKQIGFAATAE
jgi:AAA+ superfamily predicted ATPase